MNSTVLRFFSMLTHLFNHPPMDGCPGLLQIARQRSKSESWRVGRMCPNWVSRVFVTSTILSRAPVFKDRSLQTQWALRNALEYVWSSAGRWDQGLRCDDGVMIDQDERRWLLGGGGKSRDARVAEE